MPNQTNIWKRDTNELFWVRMGKFRVKKANQNKHLSSKNILRKFQRSIVF